MQYQNVQTGVFLRRVNRFLAEVELSGEKTPVHVKNTGRLKELLLPGAQVFLSGAGSAARKTAWDLYAVQTPAGELVNIDSQAPNRVFPEFLQSGGYLPGLTTIRPECPYGGSRFDFYLEAGETHRFVEVKGVTLLCEDGLFRFPDAPTTRGAKHLRHLALAAKEGYEAAAVFVVTRAGSAAVAPNERTDPDFAAALREAAHAGVALRAYGCRVTEDGLSIDRALPVQL